MLHLFISFTEHLLFYWVYAIFTEHLFPKKDFYDSSNDHL